MLKISPAALAFLGGLLASRLGGASADDAPVLEVRTSADYVDRPVEAAVDLAVGRVSEIDASGRVLDPDLPFQLDRGRLVFLLKGATRKDAVRRYRLSTDRGKAVAPLVECADAEDEGQASFKVTTPAGTWFYHKEGAGFSSLVDRDGNDWLGYRPGGGSDGKYRGIPNAVHPEGHFHPGGTTCESRLVAMGPLKVTIESESKDKKWACRWEIFPSFARLTMLKADKPWWFLYEGTPGGKLDPASDFSIRSDGKKSPLSERWTGDLPAPEWIAFADGALSRSILVLHHEDDALVDSYWPMQGNMTVFGFGRDGLAKHLVATPSRFSVALVEDRSPEGLSRAALSLLHEPVARIVEAPRR